MEKIDYSAIGKILQEHLDGTAAPVYITKAKKKNPISDAFAEIVSRFKLTTDNEKDLVIHYLLSQIQFKLTERKVSIGL